MYYYSLLGPLIIKTISVFPVTVSVLQERQYAISFKHILQERHKAVSHFSFLFHASNLQKFHSNLTNTLVSLSLSLFAIPNQSLDPANTNPPILFSVHSFRFFTIRFRHSFWFIDWISKILILIRRLWSVGGLELKKRRRRIIMR